MSLQSHHIFVASCDEELPGATEWYETLQKQFNNGTFHVFDWFSSYQKSMENSQKEERIGALESYFKTIHQDCEKVSIVIRTTWDYVDHYDEFLDWLHMLAVIQNQSPNSFQIYNEPEMMIWNSSKRYLFEIQNEWKGFHIVPSQIMTREQFESVSNEDLIEKYCNEFECDKIVIKPMVSAGSFNTFVLSRDSETTHDFAKDSHTKLESLRTSLRESDFKTPDRYNLIVQPFIQRIVTDGEYSFIYIAEKPSHMLWKKPKEGDFRVQGAFGGSNVYVPSTKFNQTIHQHMQDLFEKVKQEKSPNKLILYCRLDVVIDWELNRVEICEIELIEPHLYFETIQPEDESDAIQREITLYNNVL